MSAVTAINVLLRIRETAAQGKPLARDDARYFMSAVDEWLSGTEFAEAFGVKPARGEADPRKTIIRSRRDELIRMAARHFLEHQPLRQRAEELHRAWIRYFDGAWHTRDRKLSDCPEHYSGKPEGLLFHITSLKPQVLASARSGEFWPRNQVVPWPRNCAPTKIRRRRPRMLPLRSRGSGAMHEPANDAGGRAHPAGDNAGSS